MRQVKGEVEELIDAGLHLTDIPYLIPIGGELTLHERRTRFLEIVADLIGCLEPIGGEFPDGRRPDVLRIHTERGVLFIGDAKHTETPGCHETRVRLAAYLQWLRAHVRRSAGPGIFVLCFGVSGHTPAWIATILELGRQGGVAWEEHGVEIFASDLLLVWFVSRTMIEIVTRSESLIDSEEIPLELTSNRHEYLQMQISGMLLRSY